MLVDFINIPSVQQNIMFCSEKSDYLYYPC